MKKRISVEFKGQWVLGHRDDAKLPVPALWEWLSEKYGDKVVSEKASPFELVFVIASGEDAGVEDAVNAFVAAKYPEDKPQDVLGVYTLDETEAEEFDDFDDYDETEAQEKKQAQKAREKAEDDLAAVDGVMQKINGLVGAEEFKKLAAEIVRIAPQIKANKTADVFFSQAYLFAVDEGHCLDTYTELLSELVQATGIKKMADTQVDVSLAPVKDSFEPFDPVFRQLSLHTTAGRVACIDISEWLNSTDNRFFKDFLRRLSHYDSYIFVFRVPFLEKEIVEKIRRSLNDLLFVRVVTFAPFDESELKLLAKNEISNYGYEIGASSWEPLYGRITEEKSDGRFYGIDTVRKVVKELLYYKQLDNAVRGKDDKTIRKNDAAKLCGRYVGEESGYEMLSKLVGSEKIRNRIDEIIAQIDYALSSEKVDKPCIHMRFLGNPGTGKTTVARIIGKILKEKGVLRVGSFFEYSGRDFCGKYIGETAPRTASICRDAYGSVLFIDEAYSLYRADSDKDFGKEALETLIAEMENHRNDLVVIMAGYTDDMNKLMQGNAGLLSRMPYTIEFPNFTREQLYDIFVSMQTKAFKCDAPLLEAAKNYFDSIPDSVLESKDFSNARYVRNLFERTCAKAAMRCQLEKKKEVRPTRDDFERACSDKEFKIESAKKINIGFQ